MYSFFQNIEESGEFRSSFYEAIVNPDSNTNQQENNKGHCKLILYEPDIKILNNVTVESSSMWKKLIMAKYDLSQECKGFSTSRNILI